MQQGGLPQQFFRHAPVLCHATPRPPLPPPPHSYVQFSKVRQQLAAGGPASPSSANNSPSVRVMSK